MRLSFTFFTWSEPQLIEVSLDLVDEEEDGAMDNEVDEDLRNDPISLIDMRVCCSSLLTSVNHICEARN